MLYTSIRCDEIASDVVGGVVGAAIGFIGSVGAVVCAVAELLETDAGTVRYAKQLAQWTFFRIGFRFRRCFRQRLAHFRFIACGLQQSRRQRISQFKKEKKKKRKKKKRKNDKYLSFCQM